MKGKAIPVGIFSSTSQILFHKNDHRTLNDSDATITNASEAYESVFIETLRFWLDGMRKELHSAGPDYPGRL
jgi:hypothetical protein